MKKFYQGKKVLVTGGCGFIGSHLVHRLVWLGAKVTILDDLSAGTLDNIENVKENVTFIHDSIEHYDVCLTAAHDSDLIFHLAALVSVPESMEKPALCHKINVDGTVNILEAARSNGVERVVFSSSAAVYGNCQDRCVETMAANPLSPYGFSKYIGELYCREYAMLYGIKTGVLRYFNVFGPRQNPKGAYAAVYAVFDDCMRKNRPITIYGDGLQSRDFISVDQVVEANLIIAMHNEQVLNGQAYNIATGESITLLDIVEQLRRKYSSYDQEIIFKAARSGDIKHSFADNSKYQFIRKTLINEIDI